MSANLPSTPIRLLFAVCCLLFAVYCLLLCGITRLVQKHPQPFNPEVFDRMFIKLFSRFTALLMILCLCALVVPAEKRRRAKKGAAIGAGGAGIYARKTPKPKGLVNVEALPVHAGGTGTSLGQNPKPKPFFVNVEALPVHARKSRRGRGR